MYESGLTHVLGGVPSFQCGCKGEFIIIAFLVDIFIVNWYMLYLVIEAHNKLIIRQQ